MESATWVQILCFTREIDFVMQTACGIMHT